MTARPLIRFVGPCDCDGFDPTGEYAEAPSRRCPECGITNGHVFRCPESPYPDEDE